MLDSSRPNPVWPVSAAVLCLAMIGAWLKWGPAYIPFAAAGGLGLVMLAVILPLNWMLSKRAAGSGQQMREDLASLARAVSQMSEQNALSDDARRVLNRKRERELLRAAIDEDIALEDWDAAMVLVKELAERFGYRSDAEEFRQRIEHARYETVQRRVDESIARLDGLIGARRWDQATIEAARIGRLYPDSPKVEGLRHRVEHARQLYKSDLERRFLLAAEQDRIPEAMDLLKELDAYLTEDEAEPYREMARGVIGKARDNLGAQFKLALQDRDWPRAAGLGQQIIDQFPNSRMAEECRGMLESIRAREVSVP